MEKNQVDLARSKGGAFEENAGASIIKVLDAELVKHRNHEGDSLMLDYGLGLCSGYRSLSEASINHFIGLRTDLEHGARQALASYGREYDSNLSSLLDDARRAMLIVDRNIHLSTDHWHIPYQGKELIGHYGYHWNGMMNRSFPGLHPMTVYDLTNGCFILITAPTIGNPSAEADALDALSLCKGLGFNNIRSVRMDRGEFSIDLLKALSSNGSDAAPPAERYYLAMKANSILRRHIRGRGWAEDEATGERACIRKSLDYHGVKTNLVALSKVDRSNPAKRRVFLFITNDESNDPFEILGRYRVRGEHERNLGCLTALGVKHLPSTESEEEIAGHLLLFMRLQFIFKLFMKRFGIRCEPRTIVNLLRKDGISWVERTRSGLMRKNTIVFANRALVKKIGRTTLDFDGHRIVLLEQWKGHRR